MIQSLGIVVYFFMAQILSCIGVFTYKSFTDYQWLGRVYDAVSGGELFSLEYMKLLSEVLYPALLISDIIIILPVLLERKKSFCRQIKVGRAFHYVCLGAVLNLIVSIIVDAIPTRNYDSLMSIVLAGSPFIIFIVSGLLAPVVEEVIFRYKMINILENKYNAGVALMISSFLFGLAHMNIVQSIYAFVLGIVLGRIYQKERKLLPSIVVHMTINASSILYEYSNGIIQVILLLGGLISFFFLSFIKFREYGHRRMCVHPDFRH